MLTDPHRVQVRLSAEAMATLNELTRTSGKSREGVIRELIDQAAEGVVHRFMAECGVSRAEARAYLGRRQ